MPFDLLPLSAANSALLAEDRLTSDSLACYMVRLQSQKAYYSCDSLHFLLKEACRLRAWDKVAVLLDYQMPKDPRHPTENLRHWCDVEGSWKPEERAQAKTWGKALTYLIERFDHEAISAFLDNAQLKAKFDNLRQKLYHNGDDYSALQLQRYIVQLCACSPWKTEACFNNVEEAFDAKKRTFLLLCEKAGVDPNAVAPQVVTMNHCAVTLSPLYAAAGSSDPQFVWYLIDRQGYDLFATNSCGYDTALHVADDMLRRLEKDYPKHDNPVGAQNNTPPSPDVAKAENEKNATRKIIQDILGRMVSKRPIASAAAHTGVGGQGHAQSVTEPPLIKAFLGDVRYSDISDFLRARLCQKMCDAIESLYQDNVSLSSNQLADLMVPLAKGWSFDSKGHASLEQALYPYTAEHLNYLLDEACHLVNMQAIRQLAEYQMPLGKPAMMQHWMHRDGGEMIDPKDHQAEVLFKVLGYFALSFQYHVVEDFFSKFATRVCSGFSGHYEQGLYQQVANREQREKQLVFDLCHKKLPWERGVVEIKRFSDRQIQTLDNLFSGMGCTASYGAEMHGMDDGDWSQGATLLHVAVRSSNALLVQYLINQSGAAVLNFDCDRQSNHETDLLALAYKQWQSLKQGLDEASSKDDASASANPLKLQVQVAQRIVLLMIAHYIPVLQSKSWGLKPSDVCSYFTGRMPDKHVKALKKDLKAWQEAYANQDAESIHARLIQHDILPAMHDLEQNKRTYEDCLKAHTESVSFNDRHSWIMLCVAVLATVAVGVVMFSPAGTLAALGLSSVHVLGVMGLSAFSTKLALTIATCLGLFAMGSWLKPYWHAARMKLGHRGWAYVSRMTVTSMAMGALAAAIIPFAAPLLPAAFPVGALAIAVGMLVPFGLMLTAAWHWLGVNAEGALAANCQVNRDPVHFPSRYLPAEHLNNPAKFFNQKDSVLDLYLKSGGQPTLFGGTGGDSPIHPMGECAGRSQLRQ